MTTHSSQDKQFQELPAGRVQEVLSNLGYSPIQDCGDFVRTRSIYRDGDATNSLKVWKNSGYCIDYAANDRFSFYELVKRTTRITSAKEILAIIGAERKEQIAAPKEKITMSQIYDPKCLERLFPNYTFYNKKKISDATQKSYKLGLATTGKMYQRLVFPVYNEHGQIFGFSGRHIDWREENNAPKWKHLGHKADWIYPYYSVEKCRAENDTVILVESIGDSMALYEQGNL